MSDHINGYLKVHFKGKDKIRFLNLCRNNHLHVWNVCCSEDLEQMTFLTSIASFYKMRKIQKKCRSHLKIMEKRGLVFRLQRYKKRYFFVGGIMLFFLLMKVISLYVWNISFEGNYSYTEVELLRFLEENDIHNGRKKASLDCEQIEFLLRKQYNDITWVSAELKGTRLIIHMKENFDTNIAKTEDKPYNIISNAEGTIVSIITRSGVPCVKSGDVVTEGQLLVDGSVPILNDAKEITGYDYVNADADIVAETLHSYYETFSMDYEKKAYTGRKAKAFSVKIFGNQCYLTGFKKKLKTCDVIRDYRTFTLTKNYYLPVSICKIQFREYETEQCRYSEEEARTLAQKKIQHYIDNLQEKGIQIIENNVTIDIVGDQCVMTGNFLVRRKIGRVEYIAQNTEGEMKGLTE